MTHDARDQNAGHTKPDAMLERLATILPMVYLSEWAVRSKIQNLRTIVPHYQQALHHSQISRILYQQPPRHVLVTGPKGVGRTALLQSLALKSSVVEIPFLSAERFLWIDCQDVGPEDSRSCLESIFAAIATMSGVVLCLNGLGALLKRSNGGTNKPLLRAMINRPGIRVIGVMSNWEYNDFIGGDAEMLDRFTRVEIDEPLEPVALDIARFHAKLLANEFRISIQDQVVERTVALSSTFILNECHPAKSVRILTQVFSNADFERTQMRHPREEITISDVIRAISEKTGIPEGTIAGEADATGLHAPVPVANSANHRVPAARRSCHDRHYGTQNPQDATTLETEARKTDRSRPRCDPGNWKSSSPLERERTTTVRLDRPKLGRVR